MGRLKGFDRNEVLDTAIQLFWKKGYADTSLSDLEKATGVNKSGLYSEFKDKDDIFFESVKRYNATSEKAQILSRKPEGWQNIEDFMKQGLYCKGQKGCFSVSSIRDFAILPAKVKAAVEENSIRMRELVLSNVKATQTKKDPDLLTSLILTFSSGLGIKANSIKPEQLSEEIEQFLALLKK